MKKEGEILEKKKVIYSKNLINPKRDWAVLVIFFSIAVIFSILFEAYLYREIVKGDMFVTVNRDELNLENLKIDDLKKVLAIFEAKKSAKDNYKVERSVDPSL